jgi:hypothetical protein
MSYAQNKDRILLQKQVTSACEFDQMNFRGTSQNICDILNERKIIARRIVANLSVGDGGEYDTLMEHFTYCNQKLKLLLGL